MSCMVGLCCAQVSCWSNIRDSCIQCLAQVHAVKDSQRRRQQYHVPRTGLSSCKYDTQLLIFIVYILFIFAPHGSLDPH